MNQEHLKDFFMKIGHDLAGQRRCFDLVKTLLHEGAENLEDAKKLLNETIEQFELTQKAISSVTVEFSKGTKPEKGIS